MLLRAVVLACAATTCAAAPPGRRAVAGAWNYDRCGAASPCVTPADSRNRLAPHRRALRADNSCAHVRGRCDSVNGPAAWPGSSAASHCDAAEQSPINLCGAAALPQAPTLQLAAGYATAQTYKLSTDGKAYLDAAGLDLTLDAGNLVSRV